MKNSEEKKIVAIETIEAARKESENWLEHGRLLLDGENTDQAREPVAHTECNLGIWLYSEGQVFKDDDWFKEVVSLHEKSHAAYSTLYHETLKIYNPKTQDELQDYYIELESHSQALITELQKAKEILQNMPARAEKMADEQVDNLIRELESSDSEALPTNSPQTTNSVQTDSSVQTNKQTHPSEEKPLKNTPEISQATEEGRADTTQAAAHTPKNDLYKQLKKQDLKQLEFEQKLLRLEIKQLNERASLTRQGIQQLKQYQSLKQQEQEQLKAEKQRQEEIKQEEINSRKLELDEISKQLKIKREELEQMEQVSHKLDQKKSEDKAHEEEQIQQLEQKKRFVTLDIKQLDEQQQSRQQELEELEQQVELAKQDIQKLLDKKQQKKTELHNIQDSLEANRKQIENANLRQEQIKRQKKEVEELKHKDIQQLEQRQEKLNQILSQLDKDLLELKKAKENAQLSVDQSIKKMEEEHSFKVSSLKKIEEEQQLKQQNLDKIEQAYARIQKEIKQFAEIDSDSVQSTAEQTAEQIESVES